MALSAEAKHVVHCVFCVSFILLVEIMSGAVPVLDAWWTRAVDENIGPFDRYGVLLACALYAVRVASLLVLPQCVCNCLGLLLFNGFRDRVQLRCAPMMAPLICFRVVTRGDYANLVKSNVATNMATVASVGLTNYIFEVVTDKSIDDLVVNARLRQTVVPSTYRTKTGALFKARALQYCLEDDVNVLPDDSYVCHLDEETLMSEQSVCGVANFCSDGRHAFGQGVITYASRDIVNWLTTFCDSFRVADDLGKLRFQFTYLHRPLFGWKGSYVVTQLGAERRVSFDHGRDGSIAEDCYFSMIAYRDGYTFDFIEGEMHEKSPFNFWDFLQQRKRWLQGIFLTVHSREIPWRKKVFLALSLYAWVTLPLTALNVVLATAAPLPRCMPIDVCVAFVGSVNLYMYVFGALRSFAPRYREKPYRAILYTLGALLAIPFNVWIEILAVFWAIVGNKHQFYVVNKDWNVQHV